MENFLTVNTLYQFMNNTQLPCNFNETTKSSSSGNMTVDLIKLLKFFTIPIKPWTQCTL